MFRRCLRYKQTHATLLQLWMFMDSIWPGWIDVSRCRCRPETKFHESISDWMAFWKPSLRSYHTLLHFEAFRIFLREINLWRKSFDGLKELQNLKVTVKPAQAQALACKTGFTTTLVSYFSITRFLGHSPSLTDAWAACSLQLSQSRRDKPIVVSNIASSALLCNNWKKNKIMKLRT